MFFLSISSQVAQQASGWKVRVMFLMVNGDVFAPISYFVCRKYLRSPVTIRVIILMVRFLIQTFHGFETLLFVLRQCNCAIVELHRKQIQFENQNKSGREEYGIN